MSQFIYPVTVRPLSEEEGSGFLAEFPDVPGCLADGDTVEEALEAANDALNSWLETTEKFGEPIPAPNALEDYSGQWRQRVPRICRLNTMCGLLSSMRIARFNEITSRGTYVHDSTK